MDFKSYKRQFLHSVCILLYFLPSIKTCSLSEVSILNPTVMKASKRQLYTVDAIGEKAHQITLLGNE